MAPHHLAPDDSVELLAPPSLVRPTLARHEVRTIRDLLGLDPREIAGWRAVGPRKLRALVALQVRARQLVAAGRATPPQAGAQLALRGLRTPRPARDDGAALVARLSARGVSVVAPWAQILIDLPARSTAALRAVGCVTLADVAVAACDRGAEILRLPNAGRGTLRAIRGALARLTAEGTERYLYLGPSPRTLEELVARMPLSLSAADVDLVERRFVQGQTLEQAGAALGVTRERIRQRLADIVLRLQRRFGPVARALTTEIMAALHAAGGVIDARSGCELAPADLRLALMVAGSQVELDRDGTLRTLSRERLRTRMNALGEALLELDEWRLDWPGVAALARSVAGLHLERPLLRTLLETHLGWSATADGVVIPRTTGERVVWLLREAGGPLSLAVLAARYSERFGAPGRQGGRVVRAGDEEGPRDPGRALITSSRGHPDVWQVGPRRYAHSDHLAVPPERLLDLARRAVEHLEGQARPMHVRLLFAEVASDAAELVDWRCFRDALIRQPEIVRLPNRRLVAHAQSLASRDHALRPRVEAVLLRARQPCSASEVRALLPARLGYASTTISMMLANAPWTLRTSRGRYVHRDRAGLSERAAVALLDAALAMLDELGPVHVATLYDHVIAGHPDLAPAPRVAVDPHRVLGALLDRDTRVGLDASGLVERAAAAADPRLLDRVVLALMPEQAVRGRELLRGLRQERGQHVSRFALYRALARLERRGLIGRDPDGLYRRQ